jgi:hypothetical protein
MFSLGPHLFAFSNSLPHICRLVLLLLLLLLLFIRIRLFFLLEQVEIHLVCSLTLDFGNPRIYIQHLLVGNFGLFSLLRFVEAVCGFIEPGLCDG